MSEIKREVKVFETIYLCDDCENKPNPGCVLFNTEIMLMTCPAKYIYECPSCKKRFELKAHYPRASYEPINGWD